MSSQFIVRELQRGDRDYICKTFLHGQFNDCSYTRKINRASFLEYSNEVINRLLDRCKVLIIADPINSELIYGFIIYENTDGAYDLIHYAYMRKDFRRLGLLRNLIDVVKSKDKLAITHMNDYIKPAKLKTYYKDVIYDPYLARIK